jgi:hypothetical protein
MSDAPRPTLRALIAGRAPHGVRRRIIARIARWYPPKAAAIVVACGLLVHELAYHLTGGRDYPLTVLASGTRVLVVSHGGLDALGVGALAIATIAGIDVARARLRGQR